VSAAVNLLLQALENNTYRFSCFLTWERKQEAFAEISDQGPLAVKVEAALNQREESTEEIENGTHDLLTGRLVV
jgi:hypothetical protein